MIRLNEDAIKFIRDSRTLKKAIVNELGVTDRSIYKHLSDNSANLTQVGVINLIVEHTNRPLSELIQGGRVSKLMGD